MNRRFRIKIDTSKRSNLVALITLSVLVPAMLCVIALGRPGAASSQAGPEAVEAPASVPSYRTPPSFLLSTISQNGSLADTASCPSGYHMASLWEFFDPSALRYNTSGSTLDDSGTGAPSNSLGWARTGRVSANSGKAGEVNCDAWSTTSGDGSLIQLTTTWTSAADIGAWDAYSDYCSAEWRSWCKADEAGGGHYGPLRQYHLTEDQFLKGDQPADPGACALGYHFASLWEIYDPSGLRYNPNLGFVMQDSGQGPPAGLDGAGWIRTGYNSDTSTNIGQANCDDWDSNNGADRGTIVHLLDEWSNLSQRDIGPWHAIASTCDSDRRTWCVADALDGEGSCSMPLSISCGQTVAGDTTTAGRPSHLDSYYDSYGYGRGYDGSGPEDIYQLNLPTVNATYNITVTLSYPGSDDLDVYLLDSDGCRTGTCADPYTYGDYGFNKEGLQPGGYFISVDGYHGDVNSYTLEVECNYMATFLPLVTKP